MASTTLYVYQKASIVKKIIKHRFGAREEALKNTENELALIAYEQIYGKYTAFMDKLPQDAFKSNSYIYTKFDPDPRLIRYEELRLSESKRFFFHGNSTALFDGNGEYAQKVYDLVAEKKKYNAERSAAIIKLESAINSYRYFEPLLKNWPEIEVFVKEVMPMKQNLPAVNYTELNALLELPPEQKEKALETA